MIIIFLAVLPLTLAKVYPRTGANEITDGVEGVIYDIPEYEDPELTLFKLIARGIMPIYTHVGGVKNLAKLKNDKHYNQIDDIKRGLVDVLDLLREAKTKLEKANNRIFMDIDKAIDYLQNLLSGVKEARTTGILMSEKPPRSDSARDQAPTTAAPLDKLAALKEKLQKYLTTDGSVSKYFVLQPPTDTPPSSKMSSERVISPDSSIVPYLPPGKSVELPPVFSYSVDKPLDSGSFKQEFQSSDHSLPSVSTTQQPIASDDMITKYVMSSTEKPDTEKAYYEMKVKTGLGDDVYIAEANKHESEEKDVRQRVTWKAVF